MIYNDVDAFFVSKIINKINQLKNLNIELYRLAQALLWVSEGMGIKKIARLMNVCVKTIFNWLKTFMYKGIGWLIGQHYQGRGRKAKLTKEQQKILTDLIKDGPETRGAQWRAYFH
ncbi:hypothetical protein BJAS_P4382 [Bathymodiolus japonicus methanotrophic gill symbiont]|uniref:helix-turn-helix domain-containing protein n=1 Tax=Bathymodiolus japonicus methanotrophic gill symbiont TaxID=113269 RepID=UPI001B698689|nr:helix-turn-helix domain-containing protein [Bathymodiolus japonicus methanotrophic gill symbiont]GFO73537.1 hypothetical protein BJAS_P4382 [Bathymodiolus japonicus methanotrophic gill symbiont]